MLVWNDSSKFEWEIFFQSLMNERDWCRTAEVEGCWWMMINEALRNKRKQVNIYWTTWSTHFYLSKVWATLTSVRQKGRWRNDGFRRSVSDSCPENMLRNYTTRPHMTRRCRSHRCSEPIKHLIFSYLFITETQSWGTRSRLKSFSPPFAHKEKRAKTKDCGYKQTGRGRLLTAFCPFQWTGRGNRPWTSLCVC